MPGLLHGYIVCYMDIYCYMDILCNGEVWAPRVPLTQKVNIVPYR